MAFENKQSGKFINIYAKLGKFSERVQAGTPGAVPRVLEKGKNAGSTVYELYHDAFVGKLVGINVKDSQEYGKSWVFDFLDVPTGEVYHLQLSYSNGIAKSIIKMLPNVDVSREFKLSPSLKDDKTSIFINQDGKAIKHAYTRENPNGMPDMVQIMVKGNPTWDDTAQLAFLQDMVNKTIIPKLDNAKPITSALSVDDYDNYVSSEADASTPTNDDPGF